MEIKNATFLLTEIFVRTSMHSSGMRAVRSSGRRGEGVYPSMHWAGGVCPGGCLPGGCLPKCMLGYTPYEQND